jgi:EAL domain-containing protein (putative c-di-GMP-specific phosphodiesterase class I)
MKNSAESISGVGRHLCPRHVSYRAGHRCTNGGVPFPGADRHPIPPSARGVVVTVSVEALTRWWHPAHGAVSPDVFIPLAENSEMIATMTRRAVESALAAVQLLNADGHPVGVSVNLSARLLSDLELPHWLASYLRNARVAADRLTIEVTETAITADPIRAMKVLDDVRQLGVRISIDDFGTGYSSLSYLRRLRPDEIKIDKSFVMQMCSDEDNAVIVRSTIDLAHGLGLEVVAEGVEDQATYDALAALGCDRIQGYHIARPMAVTPLREWVAGLNSPLGIPWRQQPPAGVHADILPMRRSLRPRPERSATA